MRQLAMGTDRYIVGEVKRFDQKNTMFSRRRWDESVSWATKFDGPHPLREKPGYGLNDIFFANAAWWLDLGFARGVTNGREGLYAWEAKQWGETRPPAGLKLAVDDPSRMTRIVKKAARFYGASLVGVCELDRRWVYSHSYHVATKEHAPIELSPELKYAIVIAVEMDYAAIKSSPTHISGAAVGLGYSRMAIAAGLLAQYIRGLGWKAIPLGNDTALSVPLTIEAGLGELSRCGVVITREFGPRVRLCKVFTDLPLVGDKPVEFGVWDFCRKCVKCARNCPGQAIEYGEPSDKVHNVCNNSGLRRWPVNAEKCFKFWADNGGGCSNCIRVCPFNKPSGWLHRTARWGVKNTPWLDSFFIRADDFLGYGKRVNPELFWQ